MSSFKMEYRLLGDTGLKVSVLGLGAMTFDSVEKAINQLKCVRKYGVNFIDNAEAYGNPIRGTSEVNFGKALQILQLEDPILYRRSDLVITTKLFWGPQRQGIVLGPNREAFGKNEMGLSRKHLMEGMADSLKRMQLDYVDIVYAHRPDALTSIEEVVRSFTQIIRNGQAFYWGTSMWTTTQLIEAHYIAKMNGWIAPVVEQPIYSMFTRDVVEYEYLDMFKAPYKKGTTIWNALDRGILSGKYNKSISEDFRLGGKNKLGAFVGGKSYVTKDKLDKVEKLMQIAKEMDVSVAQLAVGWVIKNRNVTVCILGATKVHQLEESMGAIDAANKLNKDRMNRIDGILQNKPEPKMLDRIWRTSKQVISKL